MADAEKKMLEQGEIFALGWFYDHQETAHVMRACRRFNLQRISEEMISRHSPKTKITVREHLENLQKELIRRGVAVPANVRFFTHTSGDDNVHALDEDFYRE